MENLRLFIACKLEKSVLDKIVETQKEFQRLNLDAKWVARENIHITLKFIGIVNSDLLEKIIKKLEMVSKKNANFDLELENVGIFPKTGNPRVLWVGSTEGADKLMALSQDVEEALEDFGVLEEEREFTPHITLARIKSPKNKDKLIELAEQNCNLRFGKMEVKYFTLFQSQLTKQGPIYTDLKTFMLKSN